MSTNLPTTPRGDTIQPDGRGNAVQQPRRRSTETKSAFKTTELIIYILAVIATVITAIAVGNAHGAGPDIFNAYQAMQLIVILTIGYLVSRGLAKSGSRDHYDA